MAYSCDLGSGQKIYLDNPGEQTTIASVMSSSGQQQQSSSSFNTGAWTEPPQVFQTSLGLLIKLFSQRGETFIQVQGQTIQITQQVSETQQAQPIPLSPVGMMPSQGMGTPMQPMKPIEPMQPMKMSPMKPMTMGDMTMSVEPMQMQMGNMQMQMGNTSKDVETASSPKAGQRRFCTQCGQAVDEGDRFCASCGHELSK